jgi:hypothetical protein
MVFPVQFPADKRIRECAPELFVGGDSLRAHSSKLSPVSVQARLAIGLRCYLYFIYPTDGPACPVHLLNKSDREFIQVIFRGNQGGITTE